MIGLSHTIAALHEEKPENNFCFDIEKNYLKYASITEKLILSITEKGHILENRL